jgi:xanthine dehydrogenase iron-sulfur cluster and FAD-binding subunit A
MARNHVTTTVNGDEYEFLCDTEQTLLDCLRDELFLTGTKEGCASGDCGACNVMLDGRLVCSCLVLGVESDGKSVETIEGMAHGEELHPLQQKFWSRPRRCWTGTRTPPKRRSAFGWREICAGAPDMTRSSARFRQRLKK